MFKWPFIEFPGLLWIVEFEDGPARGPESNNFKGLGLAKRGRVEYLYIVWGSAWLDSSAPEPLLAFRIGERDAMNDTVYPLYPPLLRGDAETPPAAPSVAPGDGVVDAATFGVIETDKLFEAVNHAATRIGQASLYRSLARPLADDSMIRAKQDAVREIQGDPALRASLEKLLAEAGKQEWDFYELLFGEFLGAIGRPAHPLEVEGFGYESYRIGTRFMLELTERAAALPSHESAYLRALTDNLRDFARSRAHALMKGPVYRTEKGMMTAAEKPWYMPGIRFQPTLFKPRALLLGGLLIGLALQFVPALLEMTVSIAPVLWLFLLPLGMVYIPLVGSWDRDGCIYPLRKIFKNAPEAQQALDSLGAIDELLSFIRFREAFGHPCALPEIQESVRHSLALQGARNPVLAKANPAYVPNDLEMIEERLTLVTGPNSGGKTAFCKTLAQIQLLAQIGCYVPAERARLAAADRIFYQTPEISHLTDGEGRFGVELKRTKDVFMASTARSLVIMDELSEGTTHEEKIVISTDILEGFRQKGCSTLLITHNHELVERFRERDVGLARQVEFQNDNPTYRLIEGVSHVSHADRVARKIGFSREDIARMLKEEKN
jgi:hypothetical protein